MTPNAETLMVMPFGLHKGKPVADVPSDYLSWFSRTVHVSSGLKIAIAGELWRRGVSATPPEPPRPVRTCTEHPAAGLLFLWTEDRLGRRRIRSECRRCRRTTDAPPCVEPYVSRANATASGTAALDVLLALDELGIELCSDGATVWLGGTDYRKVSADLHARIRECRHLLATMIGSNQPAR